MQALLLPVGGDWYAVDLAVMLEVVPDPPLTPLPGAPPAVLGVMNLRGQIVPVFDTAALLGLPAAGSTGHVAVALTPLGPAGLSLGARPERVELGRAAGPAELPAAVGRHSIGDGRVATLVDVESLLRDAA